MTDLLNALDRWRERQRWIPAWLDAAITVVVGTLIGWALPTMSVTQGRWFMVGVYFVRELLNRTTWRPFAFAWRYKPLDGVMDVAGPALAVWLLP